MSAHTPPPWGWQKFGDEWMLVGQHGQRPVVLSIRRSGPVNGRGFTSLVEGRLVPFDPTHPDARQLAAAAALADALTLAVAAQHHDFPADEEIGAPAQSVCGACGGASPCVNQGCWVPGAILALRAAGRRP